MASDHCLSDSLIAQCGTKLMLISFMALRMAAFLWLSMLSAFDSVRAVKLTEFGPVLASAPAQGEPVELTCRPWNFYKEPAECHICANPFSAHLQNRLGSLLTPPSFGSHFAVVLLRLLPLKAHTGISQQWTAHIAVPQRGFLVARQVIQILPTHASCRRSHLLQPCRSVTARDLRHLQTIKKV